MWFQPDGWPVYYARNVRNRLDEDYRRRWFGRQNHITCPPDYPLDFFYWDSWKEKVYSKSIASLTERGQRSTEDVDDINSMQD